MKGKHLLQHTITICVSLLFLLNGCAMASKLYPLPENDVKVIEDKIYHNDNLFAELRYLGNPDGPCLEGLAIFYYQHNKEVWLFPKDGWHLYVIEGNKKYSTIPEIKEKLQKYYYDEEGRLVYPRKAIFMRGDRDATTIKPMPCAVDIKISKDGKYVYYKTPGIFFTKSHKYLVEYGVSK